MQEEQEACPVPGAHKQVRQVPQARTSEVTATYTLTLLLFDQDTESTLTLSQVSNAVQVVWRKTTTPPHTHKPH